MTPLLIPGVLAVVALATAARKLGSGSPSSNMEKNLDRQMSIQLANIKSPFSGVGDDGWRRFVQWSRQGKTGTVTPQQNLGIYLLNAKQLSDAGYMNSIHKVTGPNGKNIFKGDWKRPYSELQFLSDSVLQYEAYVKIMRNNLKTIVSKYKQILGKPLYKLRYVSMISGWHSGNSGHEIGAKQPAPIMRNNVPRTAAFQKPGRSGTPFQPISSFPPNRGGFTPISSFPPGRGDDFRFAPTGPSGKPGAPATKPDEYTGQPGLPTYPGGPTSDPGDGGEHHHRHHGGRGGRNGNGTNITIINADGGEVTPELEEFVTEYMEVEVPLPQEIPLPEADGLTEEERLEVEEFVAKNRNEVGGPVPGGEPQKTTHVNEAPADLDISQAEIDAFNAQHQAAQTAPTAPPADIIAQPNPGTGLPPGVSPTHVTPGHVSQGTSPVYGTPMQGTAADTPENRANAGKSKALMDALKVVKAQQGQRPQGFVPGQQHDEQFDYQGLVPSQVDAIKQYEVDPITLSGLMGVAKVAGLKGLDRWLKSREDRHQFTRTTDAFYQTNGMF